MVGKALIGIMALAGVFAVDQVSKAFAADLYFRLGNVEVSKFCSFVQVWNTGISFGMFGSLQSSNLIFTCISSVVISVLLFMLLHSKCNKRALCMGVIVGGALGNLADRLRFGAVYDFINLHIGGVHWPAFNVADACVTCGAIAFLSLEMRNHEKVRDLG
ncbi:MAG: signal peptidase II [Anaplasma sp.]